MLNHTGHHLNPNTMRLIVVTRAHSKIAVGTNFAQADCSFNSHDLGFSGRRQMAIRSAFIKWSFQKKPLDGEW